MSLLSSLIASQYSLYCVGFTAVILAALAATIIVHSPSTMEKNIAPALQIDMATRAFEEHLDMALQKDMEKNIAPAITTLKISFCDAFEEPLCEYLASPIIPASVTVSKRRGSLSITKTLKSPVLLTVRALSTFRRRRSRIEPNAIDFQQQQEHAEQQDCGLTSIS